MKLSMIRIADIFSADISAYYLGRSRILAINITKKFENVVICPPGTFSLKLKKENLKVYEQLLLHDRIRLWSDYCSINKISKLLYDIKADIVHTHNSKGGAIGRLAAKKAKVPFVIHQVHGLYFKRFNGIKRKIYELAEFRLSNYCDLLLFQNKDDFCLMKNLGVDKNTRMLFIGNGIDFSDFQRPENLYSPGETGFLNLVYVARMDDNKNHEMVFKALEKIKDSIPYKLHLVGNGPLFGQHKARVSKSKWLRDNVVFHGFIERKEISKITQKCHINLLTSKQEGKPRTVMEAAYMGIPTIATDIDGTREVVIPNKTGELVKYGDSNALAEKILEFYKNEQKWKALSETAKEYAEKNFDEKVIVRKLIKIYEAVYNNKIDKLIAETNSGFDWIE